MNTWKEYIESKFSPISDFQIEDKTQKGEVGIYSLTHNLTETRFDFIYPDEDWKKIGDVQFYNPKTKGWSGEFWEAEFNEKEKNRLNEFLKPALEKGWSSKDFYFFGKHYQSKVYWNKSFDGKNFGYYTGFGCLWIVLFPFFWLITKLMERNLISGMKKTIIEPTNKNVC
ncbi:MAG: hypothetical protein CVV22_08680 [Ignavibacteriae bacterium HGW-Ignavibacteriae-1]|nr:MAG: hypothetical protein CVV22_08680 [Ignavibacteriae bacterium HGW-Ignavibacteriae-1]